MLEVDQIAAVLRFDPFQCAVDARIFALCGNLIGVVKKHQRVVSQVRQQGLELEHHILQQMRRIEKGKAHLLQRRNRGGGLMTQAAV